MTTTDTGSSRALGPVMFTSSGAEPVRAASQTFVTVADGSLYPLPQNPDVPPVPAGGYPGALSAQTGATYGGSSISLGGGTGTTTALYGPAVFVQAAHPGIPEHCAAPGGAAAVGGLPAEPLPPGQHPPWQPMTADGSSAGYGMAFGAAAVMGQGWSGPRLSQPLASESVATAAAMPPGSTASIGGSRWRTQAMTDPTRTLEPTTMGTTGALQPPGGGASVEELMNFVEMQLDSIGEAPVLGGFVMLGPQDRRRGGACRAMRYAAVHVSPQRPCHDMVRMHASDPLARTATANAAPASRERHTASARAGGPGRSVGTHIGWPASAPLRFSLVGPHLQHRRCPFPRSGGAVHAGPPPAPNPGTHVPWLMHERQQPVDACVHACMSPPPRSARPVHADHAACDPVPPVTIDPDQLPARVPRLAPSMRCMPSVLFVSPHITSAQYSSPPPQIPASMPDVCAALQGRR